MFAEQLLSGKYKDLEIQLSKSSALDTKRDLFIPIVFLTTTFFFCDQFFSFAQNFPSIPNPGKIGGGVFSRRVFVGEKTLTRSY